MSEVCRRYEAGESAAVLASAVGVAMLTVYHWLEDNGVAKRGRGRPKKTPIEVQREEPITLEPQFEWVSDNEVQVTLGVSSVLIDRDRLNYSGDRELGQTLISGKNPELIAKFEEYVARKGGVS